jgi:hypothetical protein
MEDCMRGCFAYAGSILLLALLLVLLPVLPLLAGLTFWRRRYAMQYAQTLRKCIVHMRAISEGPALHYFNDVAGRVNAVPVQIQGHCVQCGRCCMEHRCMFLEQLDTDKFGCGIYGSRWRRFSNCGSFPLSQHDIDRYDCPSYYVVSEVPVVFYKPKLNSVLPIQ